MRNSDEKKDKGGAKRARKSADPLPKCDGSLQSNSFVEEFRKRDVKVQRSLENLATKQKRTDDDLNHLRDEFNKQKGASTMCEQDMLNRIRELEDVVRAHREFIGMLYNPNALEGLMSKMPFPRMEEVHGRLHFPWEKQAIYEDIWYYLLQGIRRYAEVDNLIREIQVCRDEKDVMRVLVSYAERYPHLRTNLFLHRQEGLRQLCSLSDHIVLSTIDFRRFVRKLSDAFAKMK
jgi:hypothetical protein